MLMTEPEKSETAEDNTFIENAYQSFVDDIDEFLEESSHLFGLMGVFTAAAIYMREINLPESSVGLKDYVMFSSFGIVLFLLLVVCAKAVAKVSHPTKPSVRPENYPYMIFFILLFPIMLTLIIYLSSFTSPAVLFWFASIYLLAPSLVVHVLYLIQEHDLVKKIGDRLGISESSSRTLFFTLTGLASVFVYSNINDTYGLPLEMVAVGENIPIIPLLGIYLAIWWCIGSFSILLINSCSIIVDEFGSFSDN